MFLFNDSNLQQKIYNKVLTNLISLKGRDDYSIADIIARDIIYLLKKEKAIK